MGVNITKYKIFAFVVSTAIAGLSDVHMPISFSSLPPCLFFTNSTFAVTLAVLGGWEPSEALSSGAIILTVA
jgi:ABC-type branched-subunit amino acid transport system permease subunit